MAANGERLANPAPLGLIGFGLTTVLLSLINAGVLPKAGENVVIPLAMAYGGTIQILAGLLEFRAANTFGMTAFLSYGAFWWWFALLLLLGGNHVLPLDGTGTTIGVALLLWGVFTMYMWIATFRLVRALWWIFLTLWIAFYLLGFGALLGMPALTQFGGWVGNRLRIAGDVHKLRPGDQFRFRRRFPSGWRAPHSRIGAPDGPRGRCQTRLSIGQITEGIEMRRTVTGVAAASIVTCAGAWLTLWPAVAASTAPDFAPDSGTAWVSRGQDFLPPPSGPGPVMADPKRPRVTNDDLRAGRGQPARATANLDNPILQPWAREEVRKAQRPCALGRLRTNTQRTLLADRRAGFSALSRAAGLFRPNSERSRADVGRRSSAAPHLYGCAALACPCALMVWRIGRPL